MAAAWLALVAANICFFSVRSSYEGRQKAAWTARSAATAAKKELAALEASPAVSTSNDRKDLASASADAMFELTNREGQLREEAERCKAHAKKLAWFDVDNVHFSGASIEGGKWWVLITPSFDHANLPHIVNNMIMFVCCAPELEAEIGAAAMVLAYVSTGAAGWLLNYVLLKWQFRNDLGEMGMWQLGAKFQSSCGSSTATYGVAALAAIVSPRLCVATLGVSGLSVASSLLVLLWFAPLACGDGYNVQPWVKPDKRKEELHPKKTDNQGEAAVVAATVATPPLCAPLNWRFPLFVLAAAGCRLWLVEPLFSHSWVQPWGSTCPITAACYFDIYLFKTFTLKILDVLLRGISFFHTGADNAGHLGGALFAIICALLIKPAAFGELYANPFGLGLVATGYAYLFLRLGFGF